MPEVIVPTTTLAKALAVNQMTKAYGTFAEIGAGQEVARFFFQAGQASHTIAKTMSAYDMVYSDEIYGKEPTGRYVCESRVKKMLEKEYSLLLRRLATTRADHSQFFAYANTIATGDQSKRYTHGWMGVRFQSKPGGPFNDIVCHVRLLDRYRLQQQEVLGILGVNLVYIAFFLLNNPEQIVNCLVDQTKKGQVSIDLIRFEGPDCHAINSHLINLNLVRNGLADATMIGPNKEILCISDELFQRPLVIQRGTFRPITNSHVEVMELAKSEFIESHQHLKKPPLMIYEIAMRPASSKEIGRENEIIEQDYLDRAFSISEIGGYTLISNFFLHFHLKRFLRQYTDQALAILIGAAHLDRVFEEVHYKDLEGGLIEALGKLLDPLTKIYVYPHREKGNLLSAATFEPPKAFKHIYEHFRNAGLITDLKNSDRIEEYIHSDQIRKWVETRNTIWEGKVPARIRELMLEKKFFK